MSRDERVTQIVCHLQDGGTRDTALAQLEADGVSRATRYRMVKDAESRLATSRHTATEIERGRLLAHQERYRQRLEKLADAAERAADIPAATKALLGALKSAWDQAALLHLDKVSPLLGLEEHELRAKVLEALEQAPHVLGATERARLRAMLDELDTAEGHQSSVGELPAGWQ